MERSLIYNESQELLAELKTTRLYIEKCKSAYASQMNEFQVKLDNGLISSDYAVDTFMESADNGLLGRIKLAFMKIKESFIKFIDKVILRLKECAMISRLKKAKSEMTELEVWLPKTCTVKFSDETIKQVSELYDNMMKGLAPFKELNATKVTKSINTLEVKMSSMLKKIEKEVGQGVTINTKQLPKCIDCCISDIENFSKFRGEFMSSYDELISLLKYGKRIEEAVICQKGLNSFVIAMQKLMNTIVRYSTDFIKVSASVIADARKAKKFQKSQFESAYLPDEISVLSMQYSGFQNKVDAFVTEATNEYINKINEMQVKIDNDELISEYAIDLYTEKADNAFVDKIKIAMIKIRDAFVKFIEGIIEKVKISTVKRKFKSMQERLNACRGFISPMKKYSCKFSPKSQKLINNIGNKLSTAIRNSTKYTNNVASELAVRGAIVMEAQLAKTATGNNTYPALIWVASVESCITNVEDLLNDKKSLPDACNSVVKMLNDNKKYDAAVNCQKAVSELSRVYHKMIITQVSMMYDYIRVYTEILKDAESAMKQKL